MSDRLLPEGFETLLDLETASYPDKTYYLDIDKNRVGDLTDGIDVMRQAIYLILGTERGKYEIYPDSYGVELEGLFGMPTDYVMAEFSSRIEEALLADDRIIAVHDFEFDRPESGVLHAKFIVDTVFGQTESETEVTYA